MDPAEYADPMTHTEDWIAAAGVRAAHADIADAVIPDHVLSDPNLSLMAKALHALLIAGQGKPVNPYDDAYEDPSDIAAAIDELIAAGLVVRVAAP